MVDQPLEPSSGDAGDDAILKVLRSDLPTDGKFKIIRLLLAERQANQSETQQAEAVDLDVSQVLRDLRDPGIAEQRKRVLLRYLLAVKAKMEQSIDDMAHDLVTEVEEHLREQ
jgi:hypothetical protein